MQYTKKRKFLFSLILKESNVRRREEPIGNWESEVGYLALTDFNSLPHKSVIVLTSPVKFVFFV